MEIFRQQYSNLDCARINLEQCFEDHVRTVSRLLYSNVLIYGIQGLTIMVDVELFSERFFNVFN